MLEWSRQANNKLWPHLFTTSRKSLTAICQLSNPFLQDLFICYQSANNTAFPAGQIFLEINNFQFF
jgi:hypothetical protein